MANRNFANSRLYTGHVMPVQIDCEFTVTPTNSLGITSLKGAYVQNVFMFTSTTPGNGNVNPATPNITVTNPNPAAGTILVQLQDSFNKLYEFNWGMTSPNGADVKIDNSAMTAGVAYTITILGTATAAKWHAIGVPAGIVPAVGVSFIALTDGGAGNTLNSRVAPSATNGSEVFAIEHLGSASLQLPPNIGLQGYGGQLIFQCRNDSSADHSAIVTPATGSVIRMSFMLSNSSITINGD